MEEFVPQAAVLEGFLSGLEVGLVCPLAGFEPGDVLGCGDRVRCEAVLAAVLVAAAFDEAFAYSAGCGGGRHSDYVHEGARDVFFVAVAVSVATLAVMLFWAFGACCAERGECFVIVDGGD